MQPMQIHDLNIHSLLRTATPKPSTKVPLDTAVVHQTGGIAPSTPRDTVNITDFASRKELICALIDIVQAHYELEMKGIRCSDININNLVLRQKVSTRKGIRKGYLINFDTPTDEVDNSDPIDTLTFKALDILTDVESKTPRQAHHDLESFFYVFLWICINYAGPHGQKRPNFSIKNTNLYCWYAGESDFWIGIIKKDSMHNSMLFEEDVLNLCSPYFCDLKPVLRRLRVSFFDEQRMARGCKVTHEEMTGIFRQALSDISKTVELPSIVF